MKVLLGIIFIGLGICTFVFEGKFSYTTKENVVDVGPLKVTADKEKTVPLNPVAGWILIGTGAVVTVWGLKGGK